MVIDKSSILFQKTAGYLVGGLFGDAFGIPTKGMSNQEIKDKFGWIDDFDCDGTDDNVMKCLLAEALILTDTY